jgi:hypothetical protein
LLFGLLLELRGTQLADRCNCSKGGLLGSLPISEKLICIAAAPTALAYSAIERGRAEFSLIRKACQGDAKVSQGNRVSANS